MLACYPAQRQPTNFSHQPSSSSSDLDFFNDASAPYPTDFSNDKQPRIYFRPSQFSRNEQSMSTFEFSNPSARVNQSTAVPYGNLSTADLMMLSDNNSGAFAWNSLDSASLPVNSSRPQAPIATGQRSHRRSPSSSTTGSNLSAATHNAAQPFQYYPSSDQTPATPQVPKVDSSYTLADNNSSAFSNHLPTPSHTPTQDNFNNNSYSNNFSMNMGADIGMAAHLAVKQALMEQQSTNESGCPDFGHSSRQSVSSYGTDSPATPHNGQEDVDDRFKVPSNGENSRRRVDSWIDDYLQFPDDPDLMRQTVPKLDRTMTDIYADELYNPNVSNAQTQPAPQSKANAALLSPFRSIMSDRLQAANNARSQSPASSMSRGASPFRQGSPLAPTSHNFPSPQVRLGTAQRLREQQKAEADAYALQQSQRQPDLAEPKTISPKDALLDYHETAEESKMPLFPDANTNDYAQHMDSAASDVSYGSTATSQGGSWSAVPSASFPSVSGPSPPQSTFSFQPASVPNVMQGLGFNQQYRAMTSMPEQTPEFHPQLTSMESSASEMPESSQNSNDDTLTTPTQKPSSTHADTGTYTCTYHGCSLRFDTPQKLQKHKREGHRPVQSATPGVGSGMTSAALLARNSQAGPHKCERTNPTTGKPCNTVFSRPYDLTRHEDTIHNARKQKVRCALCVEDKTFSRNDALTRHMRVVHPDVDFPGKHRRRGGGGSYE